MPSPENFRKPEEKEEGLESWKEDLQPMHLEFVEKIKAILKRFESLKDNTELEVFYFEIESDNVEPKGLYLEAWHVKENLESVMEVSTPEKFQENLLDVGYKVETLFGKSNVKEQVKALYGTYLDAEYKRCPIAYKREGVDEKFTFF